MSFLNPAEKAHFDALRKEGWPINPAASLARKRALRDRFKTATTVEDLRELVIEWIDREMHP